jgi:hypothetical protein
MARDRDGAIATDGVDAVEQGGEPVDGRLFGHLRCHRVDRTVGAAAVGTNDETSDWPLLLSKGAPVSPPRLPGKGERTERKE